MNLEAPGGALDDAVRHELGRILASPAFEASQRIRRFLEHVVEEALAGRGERIKAYSIATRVFGRGDDFDPQQDSIVRIEAARLRRALEHFYLKEGGAGGVRIVMPKGTYAPEFETGAEGGGSPEPPPAAVQPSRRLRELGPRLMVETFAQEGDCALAPTVARTLSRQVISALTKFTDIFVYGFDTSEALGEAGGEGAAAARLVIDYRLIGAVTVSDTAVQAELLLKRSADGRFVWSLDLRREFGPRPDPSRLHDLCAEIAGHVARVIGQRDGVMDSQTRDSVGDAPQHFAGYQKLLDFQEYWRTLDPALFEPLRRDFERTVREEPHFAAALVCLSMLYSNAARYGYGLGPECPEPLARALDLARRAIRLAPGSSRAHHARAVAEWFSGMPAESLATLATARSLNPNEPELLAELGFRNAMRMCWNEAAPLIEEAYQRNPMQSGQYRMGLFFQHFMQGRHEEAIRAVRAIESPRLALVHVAAAAAFGELGRIDEARRSLRLAEELAPDLKDRLEEDLAFRQLHPELIEAILRAVGRVDPTWRPRRALRSA